MNQELIDLLFATTISSVGKTITIECDTHTVKDRLLDILMGERLKDASYVSERVYDGTRPLPKAVADGLRQRHSISSSVSGRDSHLERPDASRSRDA